MDPASREKKKRSCSPSPDQAKRPRTDHGSSTATGLSLHIVACAEPSKAAETDQNTTRVRNTRNVSSNDDTRGMTTSTPCSETQSTIIGSGHEALDVNTSERTGYFSHAHDFVVTNSTMVEKHTTIINHVGGDKDSKGESSSLERTEKLLKRPTAKKLLWKHIITGAAHDSSDRDPPPRCHPGTRIEINERIMNWFYDEKKQEFVLWIYGPAGVGKSAIVQTIADALGLANCLGASVFLSRPNGRDNSRSVIITIAYQLAVHLEDYCKFISEKLVSDPELVNKGIKDQFRQFIVEPFAKKKIGAGGKTWGILLDGLDELDHREKQRDLIRLITTFAFEHPDVPIVWVIASRPEPHIFDTFKAPQTVRSFWEECVPVNTSEACQDVERYLRGSFETIRQDFPRIVPSSWPDEIQIVKLADAASGLFAFAEGAVRFISNPNQPDPVSRLQVVLSAIGGSEVDSSNNHPFACLDALYTYILSSISPEVWQMTERVLGAISILSLTDYKFTCCAMGLSLLFNCEQSQIYTSINDLYSVVNIPLDVYGRFSIHHASFSDFLRDSTRSKQFNISPEYTKLDLEQCGVRIWLDFKRNSPRGPSRHYYERWYDHALQFHPDPYLYAEVACLNCSLFCFIHRQLARSLWTRWDFLEENRAQDYWDHFLDLLLEVDATTICHGCSDQSEVIKIMFRVWRSCPEAFSRAGIIREISLEQLELDHLEWPDQIPAHSWRKRETPIKSFYDKIKPYSSQDFDEYMLGLKYIRQHNPNLPVLIVGTPGNQFAVLMYKYSERDPEGCPFHLKMQGGTDFEKYEYHGFYCIPYPDGV